MWMSCIILECVYIIFVLCILSNAKHKTKTFLLTKCQKNILLTFSQIPYKHPTSKKNISNNGRYQIWKINEHPGTCTGSKVNFFDTDVGAKKLSALCTGTNGWKSTGTTAMAARCHVFGGWTFSSFVEKQTANLSVFFIFETWYLSVAALLLFFHQPLGLGPQLHYIWANNYSFQSHWIHVWYICLHINIKSTNCREIYRTWILKDTLTPLHCQGMGLAKPFYFCFLTKLFCFDNYKRTSTTY